MINVRTTWLCSSICSPFAPFIQLQQPFFIRHRPFYTHHAPCSEPHHPPRPAGVGPGETVPAGYSATYGRIAKVRTEADLEERSLSINYVTEPGDFFGQNQSIPAEAPSLHRWTRFSFAVGL